MWESEFRDQYILIEVTDFCNLNCVMCSHENIPGPHSRAKGFMSFEQFKKIVDELPEKKVAYGYKLFWLGEPFLNPDFPAMLSYLYSKIRNRPEYIDLHTNAHFLHADNRKLLLQCGDKIPRLTISLDAIRPETYRKIRRGGELKNAMENVNALLAEREQAGLTQPTLIFQFIIMDENREEALEFQNYWKERVISLKKKSGFFQKLAQNIFSERLTDVVWFKRIDVAPERRAWAERIYLETARKFGLKKEKNNEIEVIVSIDNLWDSEMKTSEPAIPVSPATEHNSLPSRPVCSAPFKSPCIMWDGTLTVCCFDPAMQYCLGNLRDKTFTELWHGPLMDKFRLSQIRGEFDKIITADGFPKCLHCTGYDTPRITDEEIRQYLAATGRTDEWNYYLRRRYG
ncbi:MAG: radical SAM protein [Candidatus Wallbacteria bacterium]|nr:radical SAM protein [Candidatus Wallbacteria bacterium]